MIAIQPNPALDLVLERIIDVPPHLVWTAWTTPDHVKKWFTPAPWKTVACDIDLRPGGAFTVVMQSPEGQNFPNTGCYLEVIPNQRLVWTNALEPGYRPSQVPSGTPESPLVFTAVIALEPHGEGTKYTATVIHGDPESCKRHEAMGFRQGWGTALDQLVAMLKAS